MTNLIPWIFIVAFLFFVVLVGTVVAVMLRDPSRLMLGQISGSEFIAIHRVLVGDSVRGEHMETFIFPSASTAVTPLEQTQDQQGPETEGSEAG